MSEHNSVNNLMFIKETLKKKFNDQKNPTIIAVSKTFDKNKIMPVINSGHIDFGENKVQEAYEKWVTIKETRENLKLHMIGKLQSNKAKIAVSLFDYIHSLDNKKLADRIANEQIKQKKIPKIFIQVNIGKEEQKSGIGIDELYNFNDYCQNINLKIIGLMCIPPINESSTNFFKKLYVLSRDLKLKELSMGMSTDYIDAVENGSTFIRIGSSIFGSRNS
tara:strand:+ start:368 stop:1027 length:660 start_codon:yes stop_codon:yes gene_type:complete